MLRTTAIALLALSACLGPPAPAPAPFEPLPQPPTCTRTLDASGAPFVQAQRLATLVWPPGADSPDGGQGVSDLGNPGQVLGAALSEDALWVMVTDQLFEGRGLNTGGLARLPLDGGAPEAKLTGLSPTAFAAEAGGVLFGEGSSVYRLGFESSAPELVLDAMTVADPARGRPTVWGLAADDRQVFVALSAAGGDTLLALPAGGGAPSETLERPQHLEGLTAVPGGALWFEQGTSGAKLLAWKVGAPAPTELLATAEIRNVAVLSGEVFVFGFEALDPSRPADESAFLDAVDYRTGARRRLSELSPAALNQAVVLASAGGRLLLGEAQCDPTLHVLAPATGRVLANANLPGTFPAVVGRGGVVATTSLADPLAFGIQSRVLVDGLP